MISRTIRVIHKRKVADLTDLTLAAGEPVFVGEGTLLDDGETPSPQDTVATVGTLQRIGQ